VESRSAVRETDNSMDDEMIGEDCDEKRSYTPEPRTIAKIDQSNPKYLNHSMIGLKGTGAGAAGVNSVYKSAKNDLSFYISKNKS